MFLEMLQLRREKAGHCFQNLGDFLENRENMKQTRELRVPV